jgi:hypothetical protein
VYPSYADAGVDAALPVERSSASVGPVQGSTREYPLQGVRIPRPSLAGPGDPAAPMRVERRRPIEGALLKCLDAFGLALCSLRAKARTEFKAGLPPADLLHMFIAHERHRAEDALKVAFCLLLALALLPVLALTTGAIDSNVWLQWTMHLILLVLAPAIGFASVMYAQWSVTRPTHLMLHSLGEAVVVESTRATSIMMTHTAHLDHLDTRQNW